MGGRKCSETRGGDSVGRYFLPPGQTLKCAHRPRNICIFQYLKVSHSIFSKVLVSYSVLSFQRELYQLPCLVGKSKTAFAKVAKPVASCAPQKVAGL